MLPFSLLFYCLTLFVALKPYHAYLNIEKSLSAISGSTN